MFKVYILVVTLHYWCDDSSCSRYRSYSMHFLLWKSSSQSWVHFILLRFHEHSLCICSCLLFQQWNKSLHNYSYHIPCVWRSCTDCDVSTLSDKWRNNCSCWLHEKILYSIPNLQHKHGIHKYQQYKYNWDTLETTKRFDLATRLDLCRRKLIHDSKSWIF